LKPTKNVTLVSGALNFGFSGPELVTTFLHFHLV